ncbi:hypothetical protein MSNKSG1_00391 [Marinobacter santoriniensis NKSG1]|uniref:Peptidoglycan binding-like domain-containing protein n=2 Tax=Marinobacter santoriniensis TaxID=523742 RepID=M7CWQ3_9GAMM|nr:hypothetical protein MSNKSG1_00391 [Marinobacter santoriniensis NKSG1]
MSTMKNPTRNLGRLLAAAGAAALLGLAPLAQANETVALKNALYGAGYDISNVSPDMDDATRSALTSFQKDHGLQATGILDDETKKALGMISMKVAAAAPAKASAKTAEKADKAAPAKADQPAEAKKEDKTIEEDDDGGWSLW